MMIIIIICQMIGESPKKDAVESYNNVPQLVFPTPREKVVAGSIASLNSNLLSVSVRAYVCVSTILST